VFDFARIGFVKLGSDGMETRSKGRTDTALTGLDVFVIGTLQSRKIHKAWEGSAWDFGNSWEENKWTIIPALQYLIPPPSSPTIASQLYHK
jgi:hypothetical protein